MLKKLVLLSAVMVLSVGGWYSWHEYSIHQENILKNNIEKNFSFESVVSKAQALAN